jgi:SAM-dependent methyltransferase
LIAGIGLPAAAGSADDRRMAGTQLSPEVRDYYLAGAERGRLAAGTGRLEFLRTWDVLVRTLPAPPAEVLDVGGAVGAYARPLAEAGYRVRLVDPLPEHVAQASALGVPASVGDARRLPAQDGSADAVLLFGPLYHLTDRADRVRAWREAARVVRPGGVVVAATISRYASFFDGFARERMADPRFRAIVESDLADGVHRNPDNEPGWFTTAYFAHPDEPAAEAREAGLAPRRVVAVETALWLAGAPLERILADATMTGALLDLARQIEAEPTLLGASSHLLTIADR